MKSFKQNTKTKYLNFERKKDIIGRIFQNGDRNYQKISLNFVRAYRFRTGALLGFTSDTHKVLQNNLKPWVFGVNLGNDLYQLKPDSVIFRLILHSNLDEIDITFNGTFAG